MSRKKRKAVAPGHGFGTRVLELPTTVVSVARLDALSFNSKPRQPLYSLFIVKVLWCLHKVGEE